MELSILQFFESIRNTFLTALFAVITACGEELLLIIVIALLYWLYDKRFGEQLVFTALTSAVGNAVLKSVVLRPRPYTTGQVSRVELDNPFVSTLGLDDNMSFPSGHSQSSASFFATLGLHFRKTWVRVLCAVAILLVMLSRLYLGVHYPTDVLAGMLLGLLFCFAVNWVYTRHYAKRYLFFGAYALLSIVCALLLQNESVCKISGAMTGAVIALVLEAAYIRCEIKPGIRNKVLRALIGLVCILLPYLLLSLLPEWLWLKWLKYCIVLLAAGLLAPFLFRLLRI